ncbi:unnamed protein product, partial [marine sediment metagenome]
MNIVMRNKYRILSFIVVITVAVGFYVYSTADRKKLDPVSVQPSSSPQLAQKMMDTTKIGGLDTADASQIEPLPDEQQITGSQIDLLTNDMTVRLYQAAVQKLLGAAHVYMWGSGNLSPEDITDWGKLAKLMTDQAKSSSFSPGKRVWQLLDKDGQNALSAIASQNYADQFQKMSVIRSLD